MCLLLPMIDRIDYFHTWLVVQDRLGLPEDGGSLTRWVSYYFIREILLVGMSQSITSSIGAFCILLHNSAKLASLAEALGPAAEPPSHRPPSPPSN